MNADPRVMEFFPSLLTRAESDDIVDRLSAHLDDHGFTFWALEVSGIAAFAGFVGLKRVTLDAPFTPNVELGWRLRADLWGRGYATEGARACVDHAFQHLQLPEVVAFTVVANHRSRAVMERLGMTRSPTDDFDHERVPPGHLFRRHVLYRLRTTT